MTEFFHLAAFWLEARHSAIHGPDEAGALLGMVDAAAEMRLVLGDIKRG